MIKNVYLFMVGLCFAAVAVLSRHTDVLATSNLPEQLRSSKLWIGIGAIFIVISLIVEPLRKKKRKPIARDNFHPIQLSEIEEQIHTWMHEEEPDIPLIVDYMIYQAIHAQASDIHVDPSASGLSVRFRIQGLVKTVARIDKVLSSSIVNRLKVLSNLVIYQDLTPQDGRFNRDDDAKPTTSQNAAELQRSGLLQTDFRIAFMPTLHGERIVIRILGTRSESSSLRDLGMEERDINIMKRLISQPQGMIVLTGPTGSGKTTTIFAALQEILDQSGRNRSIATLEDPIEFDVQDINQSQVNEERDFTFQKGLRAILRQDPDVIMVGEIRDSETAKIAVQAGMTGHLMITTVHAGTSASAFARLLEMGIPAYSLNSSVTAVVAQRLVRNICPQCMTERDFTQRDFEILGTGSPPSGLRLFYGTGCENCEQTGFKGRTAIFEILQVTEPIRKLITNGGDSDDIYEAAKRNGMRPMWTSAINAVKNGITTIEEVERTISDSLR